MSAPILKSKPTQPMTEDLSSLIAEIEVLSKALAHYQIAARLNGFCAGVSAKDGINYPSWKACPQVALNALKAKIQKEVEQIKPVAPPPPPVAPDLDEF